MIEIQRVNSVKILVTKAKVLPKLIEGRAKHSQFIVKDYLFVIFGEVSGLGTLDSLDLTSEKGIFKKIMIQGDYNLLAGIVEPMFFPAHNIEDWKEYSVINFFGGERNGN